MKNNTADITKKKPKKRILLVANLCPSESKLSRDVKLFLNIIMLLTII